MTRTFLIEMRNGNFVNVSMNDTMSLGKSQYKKDESFFAFVRLNRKILRLSLRVFSKRLNYLFYSTLMYQNKQRLRKEKYEIQARTKSAKYLFYLMYLRFGVNTISLRHVYAYLCRICEMNAEDSDSSCSDDSDVKKATYFLIWKDHTYVLKCENKLEVEDESKKTKCRISHEVGMYDAVSSILPGKTVDCVEHGDIHYSTRQFKLSHNKTIEMDGLNVSKLGMIHFLLNCDYIDHKDTRSIPFMITRLYPGYSTLSSHWFYLSNDIKFNILKELVNNTRLLHDNNAYHSDLHQNNVLCDINGNVKMFDFDLSSVLPDHDALILEDYEFDMDTITEVLSELCVEVDKQTILMCIDYYYILFVSDLYQCASSFEISELFSIDDIVSRHEYLYKMLKKYTNTNQIKMSEYTKRAILAVLLFGQM